MRKISRVLAIVLAVAMMLTVLVACGGDSAGKTNPPSATNSPEGTNSPATADPAEPQGEERTLVMAVVSDAGTLNPHTYGSPMYIQSMLYEGLTRYKNGEVIGGIAERWEISEDGREYTFFLRPGNVFSDGTPVTAEVVKRNLDVILKHKDEHKWMESVNQLSAIEVVDDSTVKVILDEPFSAVLQELALARPLRIGANAIFPENGDSAEGIVEPIGSGMWKIKEHVEGQYAIFERNDNYWGEKPAFKYVEMRVIPDINTASNAFKAGELDLIYDISGQMTGDTYNELTGSGFETIISNPINTSNLLLNSARGATAEINVRLALQHAVDKKMIAENIYYGIQTPADTLIPTDTPYCDVGLEPYDYDLEKAGALLDEAGWILGNGDKYRSRDGEELLIKFFYEGENESGKIIGQFLQNEYQKIGVNVELVAQDSQSYHNAQHEGLFDMMLTESWGAPFDPHSYLSSFRNPSHGDYAAQVGLPMKAEIDAAVSKALNSTDEKEIQDSYEYVLRTLHDQAVYVPLTSTTRQAAFSAEITGIYFNTSSDIPFEDFGYR